MFNFEFASKKCQFSENTIGKNAAFIEGVKIFPFFKILINSELLNAIYNTLSCRIDADFLENAGLLEYLCNRAIHKELAKKRRTDSDEKHKNKPVRPMSE